MNATFEYYFRLTRFRNIDLPLQGLYFVQFRMHAGSNSDYPIPIVPYSAIRNDNRSNSGNPALHCLFPPQISPDDALQSSGFIIQFSEESVSLFDAFRISLKDSMFLTKGDGNDVPSLCGTLKSFDRDIRLDVDLLFSDAVELGGLHNLIKTGNTCFPTDYTVVASQSYIVQPPGSGAEFFRIPLGLLREQAVSEDDSAVLSGDMYPCAFVEGVLCSVMTKIHFPTGDLTEFVQRISREVCTQAALLVTFVVGFASVGSRGLYYPKLDPKFRIS